ncbi:hypothetical protein AAFF_G00437170 [Aldrovandia affinis]|uniref:Uncharacterized protein n=1 Tax=Aldrovandia affinis TaxID=143900 RepID=A0AAD7S7I9_9TELE|nr:hypothetical protein AAFF_G00437170 [Aldrovandia affinis]
MGNAVDRSNSYVANATGKPIRIFYSVDRLRLEEMVVNMKAGVEVSMEAASMSASGDMKSVFKLDSRHRYVRIPVGSFVQIAGEGAVYASVFVESSSNSNDCKDTITLNFHIPCDRSFIVTKDHSIRFQKYGDSIWVDDQGIRHG